MTCEICGKDTPQINIEIDHKNGHAKFTCLEDVKSYFIHLFMVSFEDLRAVCKPCHKISSHSENKGISFQESMVEKAVIAKMKEPIPTVLNFLRANGKKGAKNAKERKAQLTEVYSQSKIKVSLDGTCYYLED